MNHYVTASVIKRLREKNHLTQHQLAEKLSVSDKTISKWETGKGLPDISLLAPLAKALQVSIPELLQGQELINTNRSANLLRSKLFVCPICGNLFHSMGSAMVSCCGVSLPPLEAEEPDEDHEVQCAPIEDELFVSTEHPMAKDHALSFVAYCTADRFELVKLYPESTVGVRFFYRGHGVLYWYCNRHGLFKRNV